MDTRDGVVSVKSIRMDLQGDRRKGVLPVVDRRDM